MRLANSSACHGQWPLRARALTAPAGVRFSDWLWHSSRVRKTWEASRVLSDKKTQLTARLHSQSRLVHLSRRLTRGELEILPGLFMGPFSSFVVQTPGQHCEVLKCCRNPSEQCLEQEAMRDVHLEQSRVPNSSAVCLLP